MTARNKTEKTDWQECSNCSLIISTKDVRKHNNKPCSQLVTCDDSKSETVEATEDKKLNIAEEFKFAFLPYLCLLEDIQHGFIFRTTLFALIDKTGKAEEIKSRPVHLQRRTMYIHPSAMKMCEMKIGDPVLVVGRDFKELLYAWPSYALHHASVHAYLLNNRDFVAVQSCSCADLKVADRIHISRIEENIDWKAFCNQLLIQYRDSFIRQGSHLECNYFGRLVNVQVLKVEAGGVEDIVQMESGIQTLFLDDNCYGKTEFFTLPFFILKLSTEVVRRSCDNSSVCQHSFDDLAGLDKQLKLVTETIQFGLSHFKQDIYLPRGILLFGTSGTGKSLFLKAIRDNMNIYSIFLNGTELVSSGSTEVECKLRLYFKEATERNASLLILDDIHMLCSKRKTSEAERRIMALLLHNISSLPTSVMILAATNKLEELEPSLRKPGIFDLEVEIGVPNVGNKAEILKKLLRKIKHNLTTEEITRVSEQAHGYTGADLLALVQQAGLLAARENSQTDVVINAKHIQDSLKYIKPSAMKEVVLEVPKVHWEDIGGMEDVKKKLQQAVEWPLKHPEAFSRLGISAPHGVLLYGPPGCSKTMIARALATESGLNFIAIKGPELFSKWVGESEQAIRELFRKARAASPCVLFFDEIDALAAERGSSSSGSNVGNRVLAQLLTELDGIEQLNFVTTVAATNRPDLIDAALLRPGRLDSILYVPLPDSRTRREIFLLKRRKMPFADDVEVDYLVEKTEGFSGAEIIAICQEAGLKALEESFDIDKISLSDFQYALRQVHPRTTPEMIQFYREYSVQKVP